ncbi:MAG: ATP-binding cassette domain-containing protein [Chloroflexi bacterium]|nr:ATP-binding cassette domain-containing protein [Chloroflexota bacterium]
MSIHIQGAGEHNLCDIDIEFGDGLTVVTGVSGSGKTSLVFDTLYHEARRRFLEIFSLGSNNLRLSPAQVQAITGLGPAIAVGQNLLNRNPNSTLATACGMHPFLRLLYARFGERHCPRCSTGLSVLSEDEIVERLVTMAKQDAIIVFAPLMRGVQGSHRTLLQLLSDELGVNVLLVDGYPWQPHELDPTAPHDIEIGVAQWDGDASAKKAREAVQMAAALGAHAVTVRSDNQELTFSRAPVCVTCGIWFGDLEPVHFHTPCPHCKAEGCERCGGTGLHPEAAAVRWHDLRLPNLLAQSVDGVRTLFAKSELPSSATRLRTEIERRLEILDRVGLGYVTLDRPSPTLSRGEAQRVRLAVALTSRLEDMLHILDEPTIGQHPADVAQLLPAFRELAGPVIYVEHDRAAAAVADQAIDLGPGAGSAGGRLLFSGSPAALWQADTPTGRYFSQRERVLTPKPRPEPENFLTVRGANLRNLQQIDVPIPLNRLTAVTGVSGSGKSTFVEGVLVASLSDQKPVGCQVVKGPVLKAVMVDQAPIGRNPRSNPATYTKLADVIRDCFALDTGLSASHFSFNRPEGACPACKGMGAIEVSMRYLPSTWIPCAACGGQRFSDKVLSAKVDLSGHTLSIADFYTLSVADATPLLVEEERLPKKNRQTASRILQALCDVGLGYLPLGQPSPTLSGGEAQRVKLAKHLGKRALSKSLLVLDEPSTGLHPQDIAGLLIILDRLVQAGATIIIVEHNTDVIRATDWVIDLGPGAGPKGGRVLYAGPPDGLTEVEESITGQALREEATIQPMEVASRDRPVRQATISIQNARAHNLQGVDVDFPKGALTVVTGVSGSGKSSLVVDVLEAEARRRFLESLSLYERQSTREGPEAPVGSVTGLGVAIAVGTERGRFELRTTVGTASEISHHLAVLMACVGQRRCPECGTMMQRTGTLGRDEIWLCANCQMTAPIASPRHFSPSTYAAACLKCHGVGTLQIPNPDKLIIHPEKPLCGGAMYSPGFFPKGYLCKPFNGGYDVVQAVGARYGFDPATTPWNKITPQAQRAFLFGDPEPIEVAYQSRNQSYTKTITFHGFYGWIRDWDIGGTYTDTEACPDCNGARLRPEYLSVTIEGHNVHGLSEIPLYELTHILENLSIPETNIANTNLQTIRHRLRFLLQVGLGYLHLNRVSATLSAGEAQRIKLSGLLGSGLTSLTILLDEPSRGLHPSEVDTLLAVLRELQKERNTVIVVEHDPVFIHAADHLVDVGPGAGIAGGKIVAQGKPNEVIKTDTLTARWLRGEQRTNLHRSRREPRGWLTIRGACANNLRGEDVQLPLGVLVGVCGVSGSGKSTLVIDTMGRALAPKKQTTSVAYEPIKPGAHDAIKGAPTRVILVDQAKAGVSSPANFLGLNKLLHKLYAASEDAQALGLDEAQLGRKCSVCNGSGSIKIDMGFLPDVHTPCDTCQGTGYRPEAWQVRLCGLALPELFTRTIDEVYDRFSDEEKLARSLTAVRDVGLGYLVLRQPGYALSGGEAQRLKIAKELARKNSGRKTSVETLYILDEPTVGQHLEDVARLIGVLHKLVDHGHTVLAVEHHSHLLASCDWLVELGPGGGPEGGRIVATGTPEVLASGNTPTAPYLKQVLEGQV